MLAREAEAIVFLLYSTTRGPEILRGEPQERALRERVSTPK